MSLNPEPASSPPASPDTRSIGMELKVWWGADGKGGWTASVTPHCPFDRRDETLADAEKFLDAVAGAAAKIFHQST